MNDHFYRELKACIHYSDLTDPGNYTPLPENWSVAISDVRQSTDHIRYGDIRAVNITGAMIIAALLNYFSDRDLPFQFTGDGSIIAFPTHLKPEAEKLINGCKQLAKKAFRIDLAAGIADLSDPALRDLSFNVAKYQLSDTVSQAAFLGTGFNHVEEIVKKQNSIITDLLPSKTIKPDLSGLECRWNAFPADKKAVCIMITSRIGNHVYDDVLNRISVDFGDDMYLVPVKEEKMKLASLPRHLMNEIKIQNSDSGFIGKTWALMKLYYLQLAGSILMRFGIKTSSTDWSKYKPDFVKNSDYRKFNNGLRLIINGQESGIESFRQYLEKLFDKGDLIYGLSISDAAVTTCYVKNYQKNHIHFIDGDEGGYTKASIDYKERLNKINSDSKAY